MNRNHYGIDEKSIVQQAGGPQESNKFRSAFSSLNGKMNNLVRSGQSPDEAKSSISGMISNTLDRAKNEGGNIGSILSQESKKLNDDPAGYNISKGDSGKQMSLDLGDNQPPPAPSGEGSK